jgi:hypothetical protein
MEGKGEGSNAWKPMEGEGEGESSYARKLMEGKEEGSFSLFPTFPPSNFT